MKYLSLFSGIGGFELGIEWAWKALWEDLQDNDSQQGREYQEEDSATVGSPRMGANQVVRLGDTTHKGGITCVGQSEIDKYAVQIYEGHFQGITNFGDITKVKAESFPDFDFLCGGFPCQAFSVAGKRRGFEDTRGTLFFDIARVLKVKRPHYFLLENVKGLLNHAKGNTFATIITTLTDLGYDLQWEVLNSKNFGVPQNRERVFIIGHFRGKPRPQVFPLREVCSGITAKNKEEGCIQLEDSLSKTISTRHGSTARGQDFIMKIGGKAQNDSIYNPEGQSPALRAGTGVSGRGIGSCNSPKIIEDFCPDRIMDSQIRRLTPLECERLQGFPDGWTEGISDTQRYKTVGNAVTVNVVQAIMERFFSWQIRSGAGDKEEK